MPPRAGALLEEVVEAPEAVDVDLDAVDLGPLRDRHLRLGDRAAAGDVDREAAEQVQDARPALEALPADLDERLGRALEPGGGHPPVVVPDGPEALPVAGVAPQRPVLDDGPDRGRRTRVGAHRANVAASAGGRRALRPGASRGRGRCRARRAAPGPTPRRRVRLATRRCRRAGRGPPRTARGRTRLGKAPSGSRRPSAPTCDELDAGRPRGLGPAPPPAPRRAAASRPRREVERRDALPSRSSHTCGARVPGRPRASRASTYGRVAGRVRPRPPPASATRVPRSISRSSTTGSTPPAARYGAARVT